MIFLTMMKRMCTTDYHCIDLRIISSEMSSNDFSKCYAIYVKMFHTLCCQKEIWTNLLIIISPDDGTVYHSVTISYHHNVMMVLLKDDK